MGLDMYMHGRRVFVGKPIAVPAAQQATYQTARTAIATTLGEPEGREVELAYWRKHPNLHGFIVKTFANGIDDCQSIPLTDDNVVQILHATQEPGALPKTEGFFFGTTKGSEAGDDKAQIEKVLEWLRTKDEEGYVRSVAYHASW